MLLLSLVVLLILSELLVWLLGLRRGILGNWLGLDGVSPAMDEVERGDGVSLTLIPISTLWRVEALLEILLLLGSVRLMA